MLEICTGTLLELTCIYTVQMRIHNALGLACLPVPIVSVVRAVVRTNSRLRKVCAVTSVEMNI